MGSLGVFAHVSVEGTVSARACRSVARTENVCAPVPTAPYDCGDAQLAQPPLSRLHSNVEPGLSEWNVKLGAAGSVGPGSSVVLGGDVLTVQE